MALGEGDDGTVVDTGGSADLLGGGTVVDTTGADTGTVVDDGTAAPDWFEKLSAETGDGETSSNRDWAKGKNLKDLDGLVKIARDTEKAFRENGRIKVPGEGAKPEEISAFHAAIGVPEKAEDYTVKAPDGIQLNEPLINRMREAALKSGTPKAAFEGLVSDYIQSQLDEQVAETARQDGLAQDWVKAQGAKKDEQLAHIDAAARALSLSSADMKGLRAGLGADRALALLAKLGGGMAEDVLISGGKGRFGVTGPEAQTEIDKLKLDPDFQVKVKVPGSPERMRWDRLNTAAAEWKASQEQQL